MKILSERLNKEINIKESWYDISVAEYIKIREIIQNIIKREKDFKKVKVGSKKYEELCGFLIDQNLALFEYFTDLNSDEVGEISKDDYIKIVHLIENFVYKLPEPSQIRASYKINGKKFNITRTIDKITEYNKRSAVREISVIQYTDLVYLMKQDEDSFFETLPLVLAVVIIPNDETYGSPNFNVEKNAEILKNGISICDALAVSAFFLKVLEASLTTTSHYLKSKLRKKIRRTVKKDPQKAAQLRKILNSLESQTASQQNGETSIT